ncbi:Gfo/Idh/MocA family oxidoreductase [bacterium]|nr:MAG: Gfo/Idh/MocA family oxidoreductase [bacterium]
MRFDLEQLDNTTDIAVWLAISRCARFILKQTLIWEEHLAMRALIVGAGGMGQAWARNVDSSDEAEIAGWIDVRPGAAGEAAEKNGLNVPYTGTDLEEAIRALAPDFVVDVTPPEIHRDVTVTALGHGIPVIGEKPMAETIEKAKEMVRASESAGKLYMVSQSRRYINLQNAFRDLIRGNVGTLGILNADFYIGAHFGGFRDEMDSVLLVDMAIHTLDQARYLSGKNALAVYADEWVADWSWYRGAASAVAHFEMEDGLRFTYRGSWCAEGAHTSWEGNWRAVGANGTARWTGEGVPWAETVTGTEGFMRTTDRTDGQVLSGKEGIAGSLDEFVNALKSGATPNGECHDNIQSLAMVLAAVESSRRKERVEIAELLA